MQRRAVVRAQQCSTRSAAGKTDRHSIVARRQPQRCVEKMAALDIQTEHVDISELGAGAIAELRSTTPVKPERSIFILAY